MAVPNGTKGPEPRTVVGRLGVIRLGTPSINVSKVSPNVNGTVAACAIPEEPKTSVSAATRMPIVPLRNLFGPD